MSTRIIIKIAPIMEKVLASLEFPLAIAAPTYICIDKPIQKGNFI